MFSLRKCKTRANFDRLVSSKTFSNARFQHDVTKKFFISRASNSTFQQKVTNWFHGSTARYKQASRKDLSRSLKSSCSIVFRRGARLWLSIVAPIFSREARAPRRIRGILRLSLARFSRGRAHPLALPESGIAARWGVVQPVGHLTVNEDGGGSNPPAPANFSLEY